MSFSVVILSAGQGKRMVSNLPKVLHPLAGVPLLSHVIKRASGLYPRKIYIVIGQDASEVKNLSVPKNVYWVPQKQRLGTGHALMKVMTRLKDETELMVLSGDVPLIGETTLSTLKDTKSDLGLVTATLDNPFGLGRILRDDNGQVLGIREEKDATDTERQIKEIYSGICKVNVEKLNNWLVKIDNQNAAGEYYLTDIVSHAVSDNALIETVSVKDELEVQGVNTRSQLNQLERAYQKQIANDLMEKGVSFADANRFDLRGTLESGIDVFIDVNVVLQGDVVLEDNVSIGPNCVLKDVKIGKNAIIHPNSVIEGANIGNSCQVGPFARIRPGSILDESSKVGNFVEVKKSTLGKGTKASHLSYIGDSILGQNVNIGAGTITCNYDGVNKHQTIIGDDVFIGSNSQLVAPLTIGASATVGAGSTITKDVPARALAISRASQKIVDDYKRPVKE